MGFKLSGSGLLNGLWYGTSLSNKNFKGKLLGLVHKFKVISNTRPNPTDRHLYTEQHKWCLRNQTTKYISEYTLKTQFSLVDSSKKMGSV